MLEVAINPLNQSGINARILANEAKADFRRVESASRKIQTTLYSPEVKRLFVRFFNSTQLNLYFISVIARTKLPHEVVEKVEDSLKGQIERIEAEVNEALDAAELMCRDNAITSLATYDTEPLTFKAKIISPIARRYLELMLKVDQIMPLLETLAIDDLIELRQLDLRKALFKKSVRRVAGIARNFAAGLRRRMNVIDADTAATSSNEDRVKGEPQDLPIAQRPLIESVPHSKRSGEDRRASIAIAGAPLAN